MESIVKEEKRNTRVQRWLESLTAFDNTLECRKGRENGNADVLSRYPEPATEHDHSRSTSLYPVEDGGIYPIRACGLSSSSSPIPGVGLGGLAPRLDSAALGGLPFTSAEFSDFHRHHPIIRVDNHSDPSGSFLPLVRQPPSPPSIAVVATSPSGSLFIPAS